MGAIASQIISITIVYSTVDADQRKHQSSASLALCGEFTGTGEFRAQMASNAEKVSIWWRHHGTVFSGNGISMTMFVPENALEIVALKVAVIWAKVT